jgi:hypothetical protein
MPRGARACATQPAALAGCVRVVIQRDASTSHHFENIADGALFVDPYGPMLMTTA